MEKPEGFIPTFEVVGCFVEYAGKILLLKRQPHKAEGSLYGMPAGKVDEGETRDQSMERELQEETGIKARDMHYATTVYIVYPHSDFCITYHMYHTILDKNPSIVLNPKEHQSYIWNSPEKALEVPGMQDLDACIQLYYHL